MFTKLTETWRKIDDKIFFAPKFLYIAMACAFYAFYLLKANFFLHYLLLDKRESGDVLAITAAVGFLAMAPWGKIADATGRHRVVLAFATFGMAASFMLFLFKVNNESARFWVATAVLSLYSFFASALQPLTDFHALRMLEEKPGFSRDLYGRQRVWATISYGFISYLIGKLTDSMGEGIIFYAIPLTSAFFILTIFMVTLPDHPVPLKTLFKRDQQMAADSTTNLVSKDTKIEINKKESDLSSEKLKKSQLKDQNAVNFHGPEPVHDTRKPIVRLLTNGSYLFLLLFVFLSGTSRAVMTSFAAMYWKENVKLSAEQLGIAAIFGIIMEIILFFTAPFILNFFGIYWMLIFSQLAMAVRCWAFVFIPPKPSMAWLVYLVELLKGVSFGFGQIAGVKICGDVAPAGLEATAQAVYTSFYSQLPMVIAAAAGGRLYQSFGGKTLFITTAIISTAALVLFLVKYTLDGRLCGSRRHIRNPPGISN